MTKLEQFVSYASHLSATRLVEIENILGMIMDADEDMHLSPRQERDIRNRLSDSAPEFASDDEIASIFGRRFTFK